MIAFAVRSTPKTNEIESSAPTRSNGLLDVIFSLRTSVFAFMVNGEPMVCMFFLLDCWCWCWWSLLNRIPFVEVRGVDGYGFAIFVEFLGAVAVRVAITADAAAQALCRFFGSGTAAMAGFDWVVLAGV